MRAPSIASGLELTLRHAYVDADVEDFVPAPDAGARYRGSVAKIEAFRDADIAIIGALVVGRVEADPAIARHLEFGPEMRRLTMTGIGIVAIDIAGDEPRC